MTSRWHKDGTIWKQRARHELGVASSCDSSIVDPPRILGLRVVLDKVQPRSWRCVNHTVRGQLARLEALVSRAQNLLLQGWKGRRSREHTKRENEPGDHRGKDFTSAAAPALRRRCRSV